MLNDKQQRAAAADFARRWQGRGYEKGESQQFWIDLLTSVLGVENAVDAIRFERQARLDHTSFIDAMLPDTHVMIEQKSLGRNLRAAIRQSDGSLLSPFQQALRYGMALPYSERPRWIVTCNFAEFDVYDMENPKGEPSRILLKDLEREYYRLRFLVRERDTHIERETRVSMEAGEIVGQLYDALVGQYDATDERAMRSLNVLCVRLVFCLYAEDAGVFGRRDMFHDYLAQVDAPFMRMALMQLFETLDTPFDKRSKYLSPDLAAFPYTNGGLFAEPIDVPQFTPELRQTLLERASMGFDWSEISPTIFGAVFESTLNPGTRRAGGMHYTSVQNIHRVIDPLFMDGLRQRYDQCMEEPDKRRRMAALLDLQAHMAGLRFMDPACGSGNFLTETYLSLRRLENDIIKQVYAETPRDFFENPIKVSIHQFYGIEINDFAVTVASVAMWISEARMIAETERIVRHDICFLPLKSYANIHEGNSLRMDWDEVCPRRELDYIVGNPPFVGARLMSDAQKDDMLAVFGPKWRNVGNIDYVGAWYKRAADYMEGTPIQAALVSTNSISQGEQVANLWQPLFDRGIRVNFACRTFRWDSEASSKAHVHVVIVGFAYREWKKKLLFDNGRKLEVANVNAYLCDAPNTFIYSRAEALCDVPPMGIGNKPIDGGNYLFDKEEMEAFVRREPMSARCFHPWYGSKEFISQRPRYCLWLGDRSPREIKQMPLCYERAENVRKLRLESKSAGTRRLAETPTRFHVENMPEGDAVIVPRVSSERRKYIPMGFIPRGTFASDSVLLIPSATLYHFGVLESNVHMAWTRAVCGRLEMRYRYSKDVVYNNFPWPEPTTEGRAEVERSARAILAARQLYPDSSLADLYDPALMPRELLRAHQDNDRAVMRLYGFGLKMTETECVAELFRLYERMV